MVMNGRWGLNIDIEGFSALYEHDEESKTKAIFALALLMGAIIKIGKLVYPGNPLDNDADRLFAHQFGDGFILVSNYAEESAARCVAIGVSLMRHMAMNGFAAKVAISTGDMTDINGCYPEEVRNSEDGVISLGAGLMTTIPVMGTALTKAHKLASRVCGNVLAVDLTRFKSVPDEILIQENGGVALFDWRNDLFDPPRAISEKAGLQFGDEKKLLEFFKEYIATEPKPPDKWVKSSEYWLVKNT
jgi:hypothetical protein